MKLTIDNNKIGYIRLPNGVILQTVAGVINTIYSGISGGITYYIPKDSVGQINISASGLSGDITYNGKLASEFFRAFSTYITSANFPLQEFIDVAAVGVLINIIAPKAVNINADSCALTAKAIGDVLYSAFVDNRPNVSYNFTGGTNASASAINTYLTSTYGVGITLVAVKAALTVLGGTIINNP